MWKMNDKDGILSNNRIICHELIQLSFGKNGKHVRKICSRRRVL